jgi:hypothetical protein
MAHNETTSADQDGEYDPWIELYNNGPEEISLKGDSVNVLTNAAKDTTTTKTTIDTTITEITRDIKTTELWGYFLSDNDSIWAFPDLKIPGNDFLVVWADKEIDQKGLHTNFELPVLGGTLFLLYLVTTETATEITTDTTTYTTTDTTTKTTIDTTITEITRDIKTTELWGYFLSDNDSIWAFPDLKIPGNDFLVVWADKEIDQKGLHTNFELPVLGGTLFLLYLVTTETATEITTDTTTYTTTDTTTKTTIDTTITEITRDIKTTELWGYFLSDNDSIWAFPDLKIPGNDFLVVWADKEIDQKGLHTNFELPVLGGTLFLLYLVTTETATEITTDTTTYTTTDTTTKTTIDTTITEITRDTTIVNQINYFEQVPDLSMGRYPNGVGLFYTMFPTDTSVNKLSFSGVEFFTNLNKTVYRTVSDTGYIDWSTKENCSDPVQKCYYKKEYDWDKGQKEGEFLVNAKSSHLLPSNLDRLKIELSFPVLGMNYNNKDIYSNDLIMTYNFNEVIGTYFKKISDEVNKYPECTSFQ